MGWRLASGHAVFSSEVALERERMKQHTGIHFRVAFVRDSQLEYVPASERRWDLAGELEIRKGTKPRRSDMPGVRRSSLGRATRVFFTPGDSPRHLPSRCPAEDLGHCSWLGWGVRLLPASANVFHRSRLTGTTEPWRPQLFRIFH